MSGKLPILMVLGLGLVASMCAAVLMAAMRAGGGDTAAVPTTVEIWVAKTNVPAMTRIVEDLLEVREVSVGDKPEGAFTDPVQILGRVIKNELVAGQPIVTGVLLSDVGGAQLATSLPSGMRAVSVEIIGSSAMRGLLFPGCRVDVIVAYKRIPGRGSEGGPVSQTLLQNVSVLAVEDKTVFTAEPDEDEDEKKTTLASRRTSRGLMVTLMVDPQQARELQSARDLGELSLSLRNPLDDSLTADPTNAVETTDIVSQAKTKRKEPEGPWRVVVVRGGETEILTFDVTGFVVENSGEPARFADVPTESNEEIE